MKGLRLARPCAASLIWILPDFNGECQFSEVDSGGRILCIPRRSRFSTEGRVRRAAAVGAIARRGAGHGRGEQRAHRGRARGGVGAGYRHPLAGRRDAGPGVLAVARGAPGSCVYFHGGGWVVGTVERLGRVAAAALAVASGCDVVSVDYRLAPEHVFPAAADDAFAALVWAASRGRAGGRAAGRRRRRQRGREPGRRSPRCGRATRAARLALQVLVYPVVDCDLDRRSYREYDGDEFIVNRRRHGLVLGPLRGRPGRRGQPLRLAAARGGPDRAAARVRDDRRARPAAGTRDSPTRTGCGPRGRKSSTGTTGRRSTGSSRSPACSTTPTRRWQKPGPRSGRPSRGARQPCAPTRRSSRSCSRHCR